MPKISQLPAISNINNVDDDWVLAIADPTTNTYKVTKQQLEELLGGASVTVSNTAPIGEQGDLWYDDSTGALYVYVAGSMNAWIQANGTGGQSGGGGGASVTVSSTAPANPVEGDLWFDDTDATLYVYVAGTTNAWIQAGGSGGTGGGAVAHYSGIHYTNQEFSMPVPAGATAGGIMWIGLTINDSVQDESGSLTFDFNSSTGVLNCGQSWSGGSGYGNVQDDTNTLTSTYQTVVTNLPYGGVTLTAKYDQGVLYFKYANSSKRGTWTVTVSDGGTGGGGTGGGGNWSTGWVNTDGTNTVAAGATLTFDHNLGTTDVTTQIWAADDANGTNAFQPINLYESSFGSNAPWNIGTSVTSITTTSVSITIAEDSFAKWNSSGSVSEVSSTGKYIKVVVSAGGGGTSGGGTSVTYLTTPHALLDVGLTYEGNDPTGSTAATTAWGTNQGVYQTINIPTNVVPSDATGVLLRVLTTSHDDDGVACNTKVYIKTSSYDERMIAHSWSPSNSDDGSGDTNNLTVPYTSSIDIKYDGKGPATHNSAKVFVDGYLTGGGGSGGGPRAYVVFDGRQVNALTDSITSSLNVDSITSSGPGEYQVNLSTPITNPKLVVSPIMYYVTSSYTERGASAIALPHDTSTGLGATTTSAIRVETFHIQGTGTDVGAPVHLLVF